LLLKSTEEIFDKKIIELKSTMENYLVIYCSRCRMWFDASKGWYAAEWNPDDGVMEFGIPVCPACGAPLFQIESDKFYDANKDRMKEVITWEWPNGELWR